MIGIAPAKIVQACYVVRDLEVACAQWHAVLGIGPFVGGVEVALGDHVYRGTPAEPIRLRGVFVQSGTLNIELVQILSDGPSAFHDMFANGEEGLHHVAMFCDDYEAERDRLVAAGYPVASEFAAVGADICYVDARHQIGHFIELYPEHPAIRAMYAQAVDEAAHWDGRELIVPWR